MINFGYVYFVTDKYIFRHLKLEIASAIPALNDERQWQAISQRNTYRYSQIKRAWILIIYQ